MHLLVAVQCIARVLNNSADVCLAPVLCLPNLRMMLFHGGALGGECGWSCEWSDSSVEGQVMSAESSLEQDRIMAEGRLEYCHLPLCAVYCSVLVER